VLVSVVAAVAGCATVTRGTEEVLTIESTPSGAQVAVSNGIACQTPCAVSLSRHHSYGIRVSLEGYEPQAIAVNSKLAPTGAAGLVGNIGLGVISLVGVPIDVMSGATRRFEPNPVHVQLVPENGAAPPERTSQATGTFGRWPRVQPFHRSQEYVNPGEGGADTPFLATIRDTDGNPAYRLECHNGNYEDASLPPFSGDFQCVLLALQAENPSPNLLAADSEDEIGNPWWNRGRMRAGQLNGRCRDFPDYSTRRRFELRQMRLTLSFSGIEWRDAANDSAAPRLARFTFDVDVARDRSAKTGRPRSPPGPPPPQDCYP
jgi:hypothetical protein